MARLLSTALLLLALAVPAGAQITYSGGAGTSAADAVVIEGAKGETDGVASEYAWLKQNRADAQVVRQSLTLHGDKAYDVLTLDSGEAVWFDISGYFGKE